MYIEYVCGSYGDENYINNTNDEKHGIAGDIFSDIVKILSAKSFYGDKSSLNLTLDNIDSYFTHYDANMVAFDSNLIPIATIIPPKPATISKFEPKPIIDSLITSLEQIVLDMNTANDASKGKPYAYPSAWQNKLVSEVATLVSSSTADRFTTELNTFTNRYEIIFKAPQLQTLSDFKKYVDKTNLSMANNPKLFFTNGNLVEPYNTLQTQYTKFLKCLSNITLLDNYTITYDSVDPLPEPADFFDYSKIKTEHFIKSTDKNQGCYHIYFSMNNKENGDGEILQKTFLYFNLSYDLTKGPQYIPMKLLFSWTDTPPKMVVGSENNPLYVLPSYIPSEKLYEFITPALIPKSIAHIINFKSYVTTGKEVFHQYKLIMSLSKNHIYISGSTEGRLLGTPVASEYPSYDVVNYFHQGFILSKYTPTNHWYNTTVVDNYKKFENAIFWIMVHTVGISSSFAPIGKTLNIFNTQKLETQHFTNKAPCSFVWSSTMPLNHTANQQGKQHLAKMSNDNNKEVLYMLHLNMQHSGNLAINGDLTSNNNIYYMHGSAGDYEEIVIDTMGRPFKLFAMHYDLNDIYVNNASQELYNVMKYPKLAIPMF